MRKYVVSRDDSIYEAFPDVAMARNGDLVCVFTECVNHHNRDKSRFVIRVSSDEGRTWGPKRALTPHIANGDWNCARIRKLSDGRLVITGDHRYVSADEASPRQEILMWVSEDNGESWSDAILTPGRGIVPDRLTELRSGRWFIAAHFRDPATDMLTQYGWYSDDQGQTWSDRIVIAGDPRYHLCEACVVELSDNELVCFMRENSGKGIDGLKAVSHDGGAHWEGVYHTPLPGCHRPTAGFLANGTLLLTYRFVQGGCHLNGSACQMTLAAFMDIESVRAKERERQSSRVMPIDYDRNPKCDFGYTGWVQLSNGDIYVVNYIMDDAPSAQIRGYRLEPRDILLA